VLTPAHRQEALSRAYIHAVAARCGMSCAFRDFDYGIDVTLRHIKDREGRHVESGYGLDIQAKSTTRAAVGETDVAYDMEVKAYEDLRDPEVEFPRILVLLVLPEDEVEWLGLTEEHLLLRRCAYWLNLHGAAPTDNKNTVRVFVPRANVFSPEALGQIVERIKRREQP
jgi:hypothetical protein